MILLLWNAAGQSQLSKYLVQCVDPCIITHVISYCFPKHCGHRLPEMLTLLKVLFLYEILIKLKLKKKSDVSEA